MREVKNHQVSLAPLPQRGRWNLLDRIVELGSDHVITEATFSPADVEGHFPNNPLVPAALLLEAAAQTLLVLSLQLGIEGSPRLAGFDRARFKAPVRPEQTVQIRATLRARHGAMLQADAQLSVDGEEVATVRISGTVQ